MGAVGKFQFSYNFGRIRTNFCKKSIDFWSALIYIFDSILQGWDYLAFSSPSAPSPAFFMRSNRSSGKNHFKKWGFFCRFQAEPRFLNRLVAALSVRL
jgi:hypothetical protein